MIPMEVCPKRQRAGVRPLEQNSCGGWTLQAAPRRPWATGERGSVLECGILYRFSPHLRSLVFCGGFSTQLSPRPGLGLSLVAAVAERGSVSRSHVRALRDVSNEAAPARTGESGGRGERGGIGHGDFKTARAVAENPRPAALADEVAFGISERVQVRQRHCRACGR